jgi:ribonuclease HIII
MKAEGVTPGVADVILLIGNGNYNSLCIEFKTEKGKQTALQKEWQKQAEKHGNKYVVCRSIDEFINEIKHYLNKNY